MASRKSKGLNGSDTKIDDLLKLRDEAEAELQSTKDARLAIEAQENSIRERLEKINMYINHLRPTNAFDVLSDDLFQRIGDSAGPRGLVNLRATANSIRSRLPVSKKQQVKIYNAESKKRDAAIADKLDLPLENIVNNQKLINIANHKRRTQDATLRADSKRLDAVARRGMQSLLQPGIRAARAAHVTNQVSPRFELLLSSPKK